MRSVDRRWRSVPGVEWRAGDGAAGPAPAAGAPASGERRAAGAAGGRGSRYQAALEAAGRGVASTGTRPELGELRSGWRGSRSGSTGSSVGRWAATRARVRWAGIVLAPRFPLHTGGGTRGRSRADGRADGWRKRHGILEAAGQRPRVAPLSAADLALGRMGDGKRIRCGLFSIAGTSRWRMAWVWTGGPIPGGRSFDLGWGRRTEPTRQIGVFGR